MTSWMDAVDASIRNILKELSTAEEFEKEKAIFQVTQNDTLTTGRYHNIASNIPHSFQRSR